VDDPHFRQVARLGDIPAGKTLRVEVDGREILLCHTADGLFAVDNLCSHAAERLCGGKLKGHRILCPLHGAAFDVRDGSALSRPASVALQTFPVQIVGEDILLAGTEQG
jgi:3-phenylpropionate/trans-cinnamate dioxygenase ferredoxin subunit